MTTAVRPDVRLDDLVIGLAVIGGGANVIMQLSWPGVGYGVYESKVDSGSLFRHPVKRTRTTLSYLAVAMLGTPAERRAYRLAVNKSHAQVRSSPSSPVKYNAFDPELQLWVAACLWKGFEDSYRYFGSRPLTDAEWDHLYREAAVLGTTLQVPEDRWPADRAAFEAYWRDGVARISIDDTVRGYLRDLASLRFLPWIVGAPLAPMNRFFTTGFLPPEFRDQMRLPWTDRDQRLFDRTLAAMAAAVRLMPRPVRIFPMNAYMWDVRRRIRAGKPLV
ncbi:oxygenase MpaB family protein [Fodinicola acaciae]|uniref:oxygenase MpaB family protein n=1 Tax=Fodinicola acaciae TaxID=2681555 RepID=UPI0013D6D88C|nr:oxygenase MpaB family protein [Fodinicola acaciae]